MSSDSAPDETVFRFFNEIGILNHLANSRFAKALGGDLNPTEFGVLNHFVRVRDGTSPSRLARIFQVTKPSMTATLGKLAAKGYVSIEPSPTDGRGKIVRITEAGRAARQRGVEAVGPLAEEVARLFDVEQLRAILPHLTVLRERLDEARNAVDGLEP